MFGTPRVPPGALILHFHGSCDKDRQSRGVIMTQYRGGDLRPDVYQDHG
jgi:hypothetical protein